ncbi:TetR/AcrR family transcriptional regulator [Kangiella aquimarina]|uniref:TetR/AcrR family transcriptional regulator n=1 Tax=Kangiella aquimarina TaxID=261965 RepID=A0ABZ0X532_9GAMM|nr:TetR/AcrR family transcriptional regulator [Kangiella aquimarina]WQG85716.1 TetR/AcrR family transcriptional regulator [Kangiella aquimarina]
MSKAAVRNPDATRQNILQVAFEEILLKGYQGLRVDEVLNKTGFTKGAFYHHFKSKKELGHAVIDEVLKPWIHERWIEPLKQVKDPINDLIKMMNDSRAEINIKELHTGCPLNNLTHEMSPLDESFRVRIVAIWEIWYEALAETFERGQQTGQIRKDVNPHNIARFLIATIEGIIGQCKCYMSDQAFDEAGKCLQEYVKTLRA